MDIIRVLYVNGGIMDRGGISAYMMNYYRHIDKSKVQIDFVVHGFEKGVFDDEIQELGGRIYNVPVKSKDYFGNVKALKGIFRSGKYKIVHSHMDAMNMLVLKIAESCGVPIRIAHSHSTQHITNSKFKLIINEYARKKNNDYATHRFACSKESGKWLFGEKCFENGDIIYANNAIDLDKFQFDVSLRQQVRDEFNLDGSFAIGHVGGFNYQKNHLFLIDIFNSLLKDKANAKLVLIGDGVDRIMIEKKISDLNLTKKVILVGSRNDVFRLLNGLDFFCLPSLFEGMPTVSIEAQVNGLPCLMSNTITRESKFNHNVSYEKLSATPEEWAKNILSSITKNDSRQVNADEFINRGYSIKKEAEKLQNLYLSLRQECK